MDSMPDILDVFTALTDEEKTRLRAIHVGAKYSASARNRLLDFAQERQWDEETLTDVLLLLRSQR
jgi:hypothetical protein